MTDRALLITVLVLLIVALAWATFNLGLGWVLVALAGTLSAPIFLNWWIVREQEKANSRTELAAPEPMEPEGGR